MHTLTNKVGGRTKRIDNMNQTATKCSQCPRGLIIINRYKVHNKIGSFIDHKVSVENKWQPTLAQHNVALLNA